MSQILKHWYIHVDIVRFKHKNIDVASMNFKKSDNGLKCDLIIIRYDYECK